MYSKSVIASNLAQVQSKLSFTLRPTTIAQSKIYVTHFNNLLDKEGNLKRKLSKDEVEYIQGEQLLCKYDFLYWSTRYSHIKSNLSNSRESIILFKPNVAQTFDIQIWAEAEENQWAILMLQLKARQLGVSTLFELAMAHRVQFYPNVKCLIGSSDPSKTAEMSTMMDLCWKREPFWLLPEMKPYSKDSEIMVEFPSLNSKVIRQHGTQKSGIGRGNTPDIFHLSEPSEYNDPEEIVDASLLNAIHEDVMTLGVIEGTAKGDSNWLARKWKFAKKYFPLNMSRLRPVFLPWYVGTDVWPTATWIRQHPIPSNWIPDELTEGQANNAKEYVKNNPYLSKTMGTDWTMPRVQQWFWEVSRIQAEEEDTLDKFMEEMAADDVSCFTSSGKSIFKIKTILEVLNNMKPLAIYEGKPAVFGIKGKTISEQFYPIDRDIDTSRPSIPIRSDWAFGTEVQDFELIPLNFNGYDETGWKNKIYIWVMPDNGYEFGFGLDPSYGIGKDRLIIQGLQKASLTSKCIQALEFANDEITAVQAAPILLALGTFYANRSSSTIISNPKSTFLTQPRFVIEMSCGGTDAQTELRKWGWTEFHVRDNPTSLKSTTGHQIGWVMGFGNRPTVVNRTKQHIEDKNIQINSPWFIQEMKSLQQNEDTQKIMASKGAWDDRFFALGMPFVSLHIWDSLVRGEKSIFEKQIDHEAERMTAEEMSRRANIGFTTIPHPDMDREWLGQEYDRVNNLLDRFYENE